MSTGKRFDTENNVVQCHEKSFLSFLVDAVRELTSAFHLMR